MSPVATLRRPIFTSLFVLIIASLIQGGATNRSDFN
jgi:hypothetical protein